MRTRVKISFVDKNWFTRSVGQDFVSDDEAYLAQLIKDGKVEPTAQTDDKESVETEIDATTETTKARKASKKNERKTILPRRKRR